MTTNANNTILPVHRQQNNDSSDPANNDDPISDYLGGIAISIRRGVSYLRKQGVRTRAYADVYYSTSDYWAKVYSWLSGALIVVGGIETILPLFLKLAGQDAYVSYVASGIGAVLTVLGTVMLKLNPTEREGQCEKAADGYKDIAEDLELFDPETVTSTEINELVKSIAKRVKKLRKAFPEPDSDALEKRKQAIVDRIRTMKEASLLYMEPESVDDISDSNDTNTVLMDVAGPANRDTVDNASVDNPITNPRSNNAKSPRSSNTIAKSSPLPTAADSRFTRCNSVNEDLGITTTMVVAPRMRQPPTTSTSNLVLDTNNTTGTTGTSTNQPNTSDSSTPPPIVLHPMQPIDEDPDERQPDEHARHHHTQPHHPARSLEPNQHPPRHHHQHQHHHSSSGRATLGTMGRRPTLFDLSDGAPL